MRPLAKAAEAVCRTWLGLSDGRHLSSGQKKTLEIDVRQNWPNCLPEARAVIGVLIEDTDHPAVCAYLRGVLEADESKEGLCPPQPPE